MPRSLRLILPGVAVHIIQRGNDRKPCFLADSDYLVYLAHLRQLSDKYECSVHTYCLMTNHVHLLMTPAEVGGCTALIRDLGQRYVQYFNGRHERSGTLWEGRFRSCLVESARYVLACYRYIERNPMRAGIVDHPSGYLWSSYAVNSGMRSDPWVRPHAAFEELASASEERYAAYRRLSDEHPDPFLQQAIRDSTNAGLPFASEAFKASVLEPRGWELMQGKPGPRAMSPMAVYAVER